MNFQRFDKCVDTSAYLSGVIWKYSIYEYKDGSCMFVMLISPI